MKSFFKIFFVVLAICLCATITINIIINPYGYYGDDQLGFKIINIRNAKYQYLKKEKKKPQALVLGSSNSMRMSPSKIKDWTGYETFNYGVYWGNVEDYFTIPRALIEELELKPRLILFCVDDWNFSEDVERYDEVFKGANNRLAYKKNLAKYLTDYSDIKLFFWRVKSLFLFDQLIDSLKIIKKMILSKEVNRYNPEDFFKMDCNELGVRKMYKNLVFKDVTEEAESGEYIPSEHLKQLHHSFKKVRTMPFGIVNHIHGQTFENFSQRRLELFRSTLEYLEKRNCKVIINIMPTQPYFQGLLKKYTKYEERIEKLMSIMLSFKADYKNIILVKNNYRIEHFEGYENHFFDHFHPTSVNSDLMIESFKKELTGYAF